ncbi:hypothetical protein FOZ63_014709, partial [Perkinsus olseni]
MPAMKHPSRVTDKSVTPESSVDIQAAAAETDRARGRLVREFLSDWLAAREAHEPVVDFVSDLNPGERVLVYTARPTKLLPCWRGPFVVESVKGRSCMVLTDRGIERHWLGNIKRYEDFEEALEKRSAGAPRPKRRAAELSQELTQQILRDEALGELKFEKKRKLPPGFASAQAGIGR